MKNSKKIRIFSALEVANICGVVNQTAINWIKNGYLKAFTTPGGQYRVYADDLVDFLNNRGMRIPDELESIVSKQRNISIAIVDDDRELNDLLKDYLQSAFQDFTFYQAFDGFETGRMLASSKPNIIILDIDLPGIDGHRICQQIKSDSELGDIKIISISGLDSNEERERILEDGADVFLPKPINFEELTGIIKGMI